MLSVSIFHLGHLFSQELLIHPCRPPVIFAWFPAHQDRSFLSLEAVILEYWLTFLDSSSLQSCNPWDSSEAQGCDPGFSPAPSAQDPELLRLLSLATKAAPYLHILYKSLLVYKYQDQQSVSPCRLLNLVCQEVLTDALQKPPEMLVVYWVVPPPDIRVVKEPKRTNACECKASSSCLKKDLLFPDQAVHSGHPQQCHPCWSAH